MSTSANVRKYKIYRNGKVVGGYHINLMCKIQYQPLLKYTPTSEHTIIEYWYDEDEDYHENEEIRLDKFLDKVLPKIDLNPISLSWQHRIYKNNPPSNSWDWTIRCNNPNSNET